MTNLDYSLLRKNKCPKCATDLTWDKDSNMLLCECGVHITEDDFKCKLDSVYKNDYSVHSVDENLRYLNSL